MFVRPISELFFVILSKSLSPLSVLCTIYIRRKLRVVNKGLIKYVHKDFMYLIQMLTALCNDYVVFAIVKFKHIESIHGISDARSADNTYPPHC